MGNIDDEREPLVQASSKPDKVVHIEMPTPKLIARSTSQQGHVAILTAARKWWAVSKLWFTGEERVKARAYAASTLTLSILTTMLLLKISSVQSDFNSALSEKQSDEFYSAVWGFVGIILVAAPLFALNEYIDARISIEWRSWMARRLISSYLGDRAYFRLKIDAKAVDNPDQRICDDVRSFASSSVILAIGILRQIFYCVAFSGLLASLAPRLVFFLLAYALLGTWVTAAGFGKRLTALAFNVLQKEADLRFDLVRVRENAESVAFYGADAREARIATGRLESAVHVGRSQIAVHAWLSLWQNIYAYATILIPSLLMAPKYFAGDIRFGAITQVSFAFQRIKAALSYVVDNLAALSSLAAETERLDALLGALAPAPHGGGIKRVQLAHDAKTESSTSSSSAITGLEIENFTLSTPHGERVLCRDLNLSLAAGQALLIVGPSGCGKSSIMRAVAGLWSVGTGIIRTPSTKTMFFLPQKPYMPLGTLRQQLCFPDSVDDSSRGSNGSGSSSEDSELTKLLDTVCLPDLLNRVGGLDAECDWSHMLSLGEQQRVAFLRLLRRRPTTAFLDEATSGVDAKTEKRLYEALKATCPCFVSIGHRKELIAHHSHVLEAAGDGRWVLQTAAQYLAAQQ